MNMSVKESRAYKKQRNINFLEGAVKRVETALNNTRAAVKQLTQDLQVLRGLLKNERKK